MRPGTSFVSIGSMFAAAALLGCSSDATSDASTRATPAASVAPGTLSTAAPAATASTPATSAASAASAPATQPAASESSAGGAGKTTCPDASSLAAAYGGDVELDVASAQTGALGLVFCPYNEVLPPGATGAFGTEAIPDSFSITFTSQNITEEGAGPDPVPGLGQQAFWGGSGELSIWTGDRGIIVSVISPPGDAKETAIAIARAVL